MSVSKLYVILHPIKPLKDMIKYIKKIAMLLLVAASLMAVSCTKEGNENNSGTNSSSLVGTTWKYYYDGATNEGGGLFFMSETTVLWIDWEEDGTDEYEEDVLATWSYEYNAPNGVIQHPGVGSGASRFIVEGNTMRWNEPEEGQVILTRQ